MIFKTLSNDSFIAVVLNRVRNKVFICLRPPQGMQQFDSISEASPLICLAAQVIRSLIDRGANCEKPNRQGFTPLDYSYSQQAEQYFVTLIQEREKRWASDNARSRAATPIFGRSERTAPQRQRASSGS